MSDKDFTNTKVERAIDYAKDYLIRVEGMDISQRPREVNAWLPLVLLEIAGVADKFPKMTDKSLKNDFVSVATSLIDQEKEYDPNPGKTRYSVNSIKDCMALG